MKKNIRKLKRVKKFAKILFIIIPIAYLISYIFFAKNIINLAGIETLIRFIILILFFIYFIFYLITSVNKLAKRRYLIFYILSFISIIFIIIFIFCSTFINLFLSKLASFNEGDKITYTSYLITLNDKELDKNSIIGIIDDEDSIEGYVLAQKIIKENKLSYKLEKYSSEKTDAFINMLYDLYDEKIDGVFVSSNYVTLYSGEEKFANIVNETKVLYKASGDYENENAVSYSNKSLTEPFTVLIMGVDSEDDVLNANAAFNGDTLILATFNPDTFTATLLSIPRDTYVPIACRNGAEAKINSSAAYGTGCVINTIQNLTSVNIDYYVKINFKGVVDLVEAVGGVVVDVQKPEFKFNHEFDCKGKVCEQDSNRAWGANTIYIDPGIQTLNGEQALAYARCRALYLDSDFARNRHQQDIIMALAKKALTIRNYNEFKKILDAISKNIITNMSTNQILSSYNIFKEMLGKMLHDEEIIDIQKMRLETYNLPVYLPAGYTISALGYYETSLQDIKNAMNINLGLETDEEIKTFDFSIKENYVAHIPGANLRGGVTKSVIEGFIGKTKEAAQKYCDENNFDCSFKYVDEESSHYDEKIDTDLIADQDPHEGVIATGVHSITFYINGATSGKKTNDKDSDNKKETTTKKEVLDKKDDTDKDSSSDKTDTNDKPIDNKPEEEEPTDNLPGFDTPKEEETNEEDKKEEELD